MSTANIAPIAQTAQGTQKILWTSLPRGMNQAGSLKLTVMVSPRLDPGQDASLAKFSDFVDWPAAVKHALFDLHVRGPFGALQRESRSSWAFLDRL